MWFNIFNIFSCCWPRRGRSSSLCDDDSDVEKCSGRECISPCTVSYSGSFTAEEPASASENDPESSMSIVRLPSSPRYRDQTRDEGEYSSKTLPRLHSLADVASRYELQEVLGRGCGSVCRKARDVRSGESFAVKLTQVDGADADVTCLAKRFHTEIQALKYLRHESHVVGIREWFDTGAELGIVLDLVKGHDLFEYAKRRGCLEEMEAGTIMEQVFTGVHRIHEMNYIHRDLKLENIMVSRDAEALRVTLIDFGVSTMLLADNAKATTMVGTEGYIAPEMLKRLPYGKEIDAWSIGVILYQLLYYGTFPFGPYCPPISAEDLEEILVLKFPRHVRVTSPGVKALISKLLVEDPTKRLSIQDARKDTWVTRECTDTETSMEHTWNKHELSCQTSEFERGSNSLFGFDAEPSQELQVRTRSTVSF